MCPLRFECAINEMFHTLADFFPLLRLPSVSLSQLGSRLIAIRPTLVDFLFFFWLIFKKDNGVDCECFPEIFRLVCSSDLNFFNFFLESNTIYEEKVTFVG